MQSIPRNVDVIKRIVSFLLIWEDNEGSGDCNQLVDIK